jgi:hypothetical protein
LSARSPAIANAMPRPRSVFAFAKATLDTLRPDGPGVAAPSVAFWAKRGAGGGTRTHTMLPSRDFKSLASTSSATSALLISIAFSSQSGKRFPIETPRVFARSRKLRQQGNDGSRELIDNERVFGQLQADVANGKRECLPHRPDAGCSALAFRFPTRTGSTSKSPILIR